LAEEPSGNFENNNILPASPGVESGDERVHDIDPMCASTDLISEFASSLDAEDYQRTLSLLAGHCIYDSPTGQLTGPVAIVSSYREPGDLARERFDSIVYRHRVVPLGEGWYQIEFIDELVAGSRSHVFRCNQRVRIDKGQIVRIIHEEIPGQRDRLNAFMQSLSE